MDGGAYTSSCYSPSPLLPPSLLLLGRHSVSMVTHQLAGCCVCVGGRKSGGAYAAYVVICDMNLYVQLCALCVCSGCYSRGDGLQERRRNAGLIEAHGNAVTLLRVQRGTHRR